MATHFVDRIAVEVDGEGEAMLMIHGLGGSSNAWTPLAPTFARYRAIRPDLPGSARSARVEGPLSTEVFVRAMGRVCDAMNAPRVHVVAHSLGAIIAFHLAGSDPRRVRSLALFGPLTALPDAARAGVRARGERARSGGEEAMQVIADSNLQAATAAETKARRPVALALVRELIMRQPPDGYARTCEALADAQAAELSQIDCPTLLVTGDEDQIAPAQSVRHIAERMGRTELHVLARCGHWTPLEKPDECNELLRRFHAQRIP